MQLQIRSDEYATLYKVCSCDIYNFSRANVHTLILRASLEQSGVGRKANKRFAFYFFILYYSCRHCWIR